MLYFYFDKKIIKKSEREKFYNLQKTWFIRLVTWLLWIGNWIGTERKNGEGWENYALNCSAFVLNSELIRMTWHIVSIF